MKKIYALAAALTLGFALPSFAESAAPAPDAKVQADVKKPEHGKEKTAESKTPQQAAQHPGANGKDAGGSSTGSASTPTK